MHRGADPRAETRLDARTAARNGVDDRRAAGARFDGFHEGAFEFFRKVAARPSWEYVASLQAEWEREVHEPMEQLLDALGDEFGRDAHAWHLHRDPYLWSHQVGTIEAVDTIAYRAVLSLDGLLVEVGWMRSSPDQVQRYRDAVAAGGPGVELAALLDALRRAGFDVAGKSLRTRPRGWRPEHPRTELARQVTLSVVQPILANRLVPGPVCVESVATAWRTARPLADWLVRHVGPRQARRR